VDGSSAASRASTSAASDTPFFQAYRPQFHLRTTDVTGTVELPEGMEMVMLGDNVLMTIARITTVATAAARLAPAS